MMARRTAAIAAVALAFTAIADAQQATSENAGEIARWTAARVVHYHMVGVYDGPAVIAYREPAGQAIVMDRVEIDLDWDVKANAIVGETTIVNAASEVRELRNEHASCPPPTPNGPYDHLTVKTLTTSGGALELKGIRSFPSIRVVTGCQGVQEPRTIRPWDQDVVERMIVPSPLMLAAPAHSVPNLTVSADKASFTITGGSWSWTYTPTIVN